MRVPAGALHQFQALQDVTRIDAAGVDVLTRAASVAGESDISFRLIATPDGLVRRALAALGLTELFEITRPPWTPEGHCGCCRANADFHAGDSTQFSAEFEA